MPASGSTLALLERWHAGDRAALEALLERHLPWVEAQVRRRLGPVLRRKGETADYVQEAVREFLTYGPRFRPSGDEQLRALLARIVENVLRDEHDWYTAQRRNLERERPLPSDTVLVLDGPVRSVERPGLAAARSEEEALVRLALELLDHADRRVLLRRQWDGCSFGELGAELGVSEDAARMRFGRALARLGDRITRLRRDGIDALLEERD